MSNIAEFADIPEYSVTGNLTLQGARDLVMDIGHIDLPGLKNVEYLYKSYHALGGNGTGTELYTRAKALPIRED